MDFIIYFGIILILAFIISTVKYIAYRIKRSKQIRLKIREQYVIESTTWECPRCQQRVLNEFNRCKCGQAKHNSGKRANG